MAEKLGLFVVGIKGMTGTAAVAGLCLMNSGHIPEIYGVTSSPLFPAIALPKAKDWVVCGWDTSLTSLAENCAQYGWFANRYDVLAPSLERIEVWGGIYGKYDWVNSNEDVAGHEFDSLRDGAVVIRDQISEFMSRHGLSRGVMLYLGAPHRRWVVDSIAWNGRSLPHESCPAGLCYAVGAVLAGINFVDCTPCGTLENRSLVNMAVQQVVRIAGRDLSTGQTMLKASIYEALARRNLFPEAWYSTNLIGNNDGFVLSDPRFSTLKIKDKLAAFHGSEVSGHDPSEHVVNIEFMRSWGDNKESWDAAEFKSWGEEHPISLRINWRGPDSFLAAPMVLDLARLIMEPTSSVPGLQKHLGFFFKRPLGMEGSLLSERWLKLVGNYGS